MITLYFEMPTTWGRDHIDFLYYYKETSKYLIEPLHSVPLGYSYKSTRIWLQKEDGSIMFLKNRHSGHQTVDIEEFKIIKLSASEI